MAQWQVSRPSGVCSGSGEEIAPGSQYYAALVETDEGFERRDYSQQYWQQDKPQVYCFWKSVMADSTEKKKIFIDDDMLLDFFDRLGNDTAQDKIDFRFVLTLVLMRKRILKYVSSHTKDGIEYWVLKRMPSKENIEVVNPNLTEDKIDALQGQISQIMNLEVED